MSDKVCFITGVGGGTGAATARRFAKGGYKVAMLARKDNLINELKQELEESRAFVCDVADLDHLTQVCKTVSREMGTPDVVIHNAARGTFLPFLETEPENLELNFRVNATGVALFGSCLCTCHDRARQRLHHRHWQYVSKARCGQFRPLRSHQGCSAHIGPIHGARPRTQGYSCSLRVDRRGYRRTVDAQPVLA